MSIIKDGTFTGWQGKNHLQGTVIDEKHNRIYYSFTTRLVATTLDGTPVGSADGLVGHLGCICFNEEDGLIYGSLEFKHDCVGRGIAERTGGDLSFEDGFYICVFDGLKITRENMDAEKDGIMKASFLADVLHDYKGQGENGREHRFGCSGIDGTTLAPLPGAAGDSRKYLYVAYGIYNDTERTDNDNQVILCYNTDEIKKTAQPLNQNSMHRSGAKPIHRYFAFTGNTDWGVQNLCYDSDSRLMFMAVYHGSKTEFTNYDMFAADMTKPAVTGTPVGLNEEGELLTLYGCDDPHSRDITGWFTDGGPFGMPSLGGGDFVFALHCRSEDGQNGANLFNYHFTAGNGFAKV